MKTITLSPPVWAAKAQATDFTVSRKIGHGWQYSVYTLGNGRVIKYKLKILERLFFMWRGLSVISLRNPMLFSTVFLKIRKFGLNPKNSISGVNSTLPFMVDKSFLGDPVILENYAYTQDEVMIFLDHLRIHMNSVNEQKKMVDGFVRLIWTLWEHGMCDISFNFTNNCGVNRNGDVILVDLGEIIFDRTEVENFIRKGAWLTSTSLSKIPKGMKDYYLAQIRQHITLGNFHKLWRRKIVSLN